MNYPSIKEYIEAIRFAEDNFDQLKHLRPVLDEDGEPVMTSGNFAVVFQMKDEQTGKLHAVKCFLREQEGRAEAYRQIAEELEFVSSTFLTPIKYLDKELFVDSSNSEDSEFPVLLMDWVEGQTLDKYIREHIDDQYELSLLAYQFSRLAMWLMPQPFAHGDLKPDNILVKEDGTLVLVDYDGMYVPAMKGQKTRELGSPDFRHPGRTEEVFDDHIDDFSLASILLSLKAIALQPTLLEEYGASDRLLFSETDYRNLSESSALGALQPLMQDAELASLYSLYILALSQNNLSQVSFRLFNLSRPDRSQYVEENLSTEVTEEDLANAWTDEYGVKYSADRKRFFGRSNIWLKEYSIREGTVIICDESMHIAETFVIPKTVQSIGNNPLGGDAAIVICNSDHFIVEDELLLTRDKTRLLACLSHDRVIVTVPKETVTIDNFAFFSNMHANSDNSIEIIRIQNGKVNPFYFECLIMVPNIAVQKSLFKDYDGYAESIIVGEDVYIDDYGVIYSADKKSLLCYPKQLPHKEYHIIEGCEELGNMCFSYYVDPDDDGTVSTRGNCIERLFLPSTLNKASVGALEGCSALQTIVVKGKREKMVQLFPNYWNIIVEELNDGDLSTGVTDNDLANAWTDKFGVKYSADRKRLLRAPNNMAEYSIAEGTEIICDFAFALPEPVILKLAKKDPTDYCSLCSIYIPNSVKVIGKYAFRYNDQLNSIELPNNVLEIKDRAFSGCKSLIHFTIPDSVVKIGTNPFVLCNGIEKLICKSDNFVILDGALYSKDMSTLISCTTKEKAFVIPKTVTCIGDCAFEGCSNLETIIIPNSVEMIGKEAFLLCSSLIEVTIPNSLKEMGEWAFAQCYSLKEIKLSNHLSKLNRACFYKCISMDNIIIPESVKDIGNRAFEFCESLSQISIPNTVNSIGHDAFNGCKNLEQMKLSNTIDRIESRTFEGCSKLAEIYIPGSVKEIHIYAFLDCPSLMKIIIPVGSKNRIEQMLPSQLKDKIVEC